MQFAHTSKLESAFYCEISFGGNFSIAPCLRSVHSRPHCVGRTSAARRPIWRVIAAITPMRRPHAAASRTIVNIGNLITIWLCNELWWYGRRIVSLVHSWSGKLSVGRNASAARRPQCVGRNASAAMSRPRVGRNALAARRPTMYWPLITSETLQIHCRFKL